MQDSATPSPNPKAETMAHQTPLSLDSLRHEPSEALLATDAQSGLYYYDVRGPPPEEQTMSELLRGSVPLRFDWQNRWLRGEEYAHVIAHM